MRSRAGVAVGRKRRGGGVFMVTFSPPEGRRVMPVARFAALAIATALVAACAAPGAVSTPSPAASTAASVACNGGR